MVRVFGMLISSIVLVLASPAAPGSFADPTHYLIGRCFGKGSPVVDRPAEVYYGCDSTGHP